MAIFLLSANTESELRLWSDLMAVGDDDSGEEGIIVNLGLAAGVCDKL